MHGQNHIKFIESLMRDGEQVGEMGDEVTLTKVQQENKH